VRIFIFTFIKSFCKKIIAMKKLLLLSLLGSCGLSVFAQQSDRHLVNQQTRTLPRTAAPNATIAQKAAAGFNSHAQAKTTGVTFVTETFGGGTTTTLPAGWVAAGTVGTPVSWKWRNVACSGQYSIGTISSTTAADGWLVYDSDSIGSLAPTVTPIEGWVTSPSYDCSTHSSVGIKFQEWFRKFQDSCFVEVSNNGGTVWTTFPVKINNNLNNNTDAPSNPTMVKINISSVAANQADVKIRFRYKCTYAGGAFNWLVDDMELYELDPVDIGLDNPATVVSAGASLPFTSFSNIPLQFIDSIFPVIGVTNLGATDPGTVTIKARIYNGATSLYNQNMVLTGAVQGLEDSVVDFPPYLPTTTGSYATSFSINVPGDADASNDVDSFFYSINDTLYTRFTGFVTGSNYLHKPSTAQGGEASFSIGTYFVIPETKSDTLSVVSASFDNSTNINSHVYAAVYKFDGTSAWNIVAASEEKTLAAADISTSSTIRWARFPIYGGLGTDPFVMDEGEYAVVLNASGVAPTGTVTLLVAENTTPPTLDYLNGIGDDSQNGQPDFGAGPFQVAGAPLVRLHFAKFLPVGINNLNLIKELGDAYPNPATNMINVPFAVSSDANVTVSVTDVLGQTVMSQNFGKVSTNQSMTAKFNTSALGNGVYFYTVDADGQRLTKRVVVNR
jgi:hypothetical protein